MIEKASFWQRLCALENDIMRMELKEWGVSMARTTKVKIFGMEYSLKGVENPDYVERLASYVDRKMREISENSSLVSTVKIAVLAALRIADELHEERKAQGLPPLSPEERIKGLIEVIDKEVDSR